MGVMTVKSPTLGGVAPAVQSGRAREAHLDTQLRKPAVVENLLEAVMQGRPGCDSWELGARTKVGEDRWVIPVRLTLIKEESGWLSKGKKEVEVRYAEVTGDGRHVATHAKHPVPGAATTFPKNGLNSWDYTFAGRF